MSKKRRAKIPPFRVLNSENIFRKFVSKIMRSCDKNFAQLQLIAQKETYGYEILTEIQKQGGEIFAFAKEGTIYPILYRLTKAGLIQYRLVPAKANGGEKKYYSLTGEGKDMLEKMKNFWENYKDCVDGFMKGDA